MPPYLNHLLLPGWPAESISDRFAYRKAMFLVCYGLLTLPLSSFSAYKSYHVQGLNPVFWGASLSSAFSLAMLGIIFFKKDLRLATLIFCLQFLCCLPLTSMSLSLPSVIWMAVAPLSITFFKGPRFTVIAIGIWGIEWLLVQLLVDKGLLVFPTMESLDAYAARLGFSVSLLAIYLTGLAYIVYKTQKDFERKVRQTLSSLHEALAVKDKILTNVSHEMRTPMNGIIGLTDVLQAELKDDEVLHKLAMIKRSGENLLQVIDQLLLAAQARSGRVEQTFGYFSLGRLVHRSLDLYRPLAQAKKIEMSVVMETQGDDTVYSSQVLVEQILNNLLGNAVKFSHRGRIEVEASVMLKEKKFFIKVADEGPGIPRANQARIFQPFEQLDGSLSRPYQGTGLGLSICQDLLQILLGSIRLESQVGKGSTFFVEIPFSRDDKKESLGILQPNRLAAASNAWSTSV